MSLILVYLFLCHLSKYVCFYVAYLSMFVFMSLILLCLFLCHLSYYVCFYVTYLTMFVFMSLILICLFQMGSNQLGSEGPLELLRAIEKNDICTVKELDLSVCIV
jgi:hypothetical protein